MNLVGQKAPSFELDGYYKGEFRTFTSADFRDKWTWLLFYPLDFTFVCPTEVLSFSKAAETFAAKNCQILGISVDSKFTHKAWVETPKENGGLGGSLNFPLLSDINKTMARSYDVMIDQAGVALRGSFLIDPKSTVMQATVNNLSVGRSANEAMRLLKAFQYVTSHEGEVCPADWDEGAEVMKASPEGMHAYLTKQT